MRLGGLGLFEAGPLKTAGGGIDIERIRAHIASRLHLVPRHRQRLAWVPLVRRPVWADDAHFNLSYHVRHAAVPHPGDDQQLKALTARIMSQQLDRGKPLLEVWFIEGMHGDRFAMLAKAHHAVADGISAFDLFGNPRGSPGRGLPSKHGGPSQTLLRKTPGEPTWCGATVASIGNVAQRQGPSAPNTDKGRGSDS